MAQEIKTINLSGVNCYLVKAGDSYILIDTGFSSKRTFLEKELESAGVMHGNLKLVILTHGDSDHADNYVYLREKYGAKIAMHYDDSGMVEHGDMSWNRKAKPDKVSITFKIITLIFGRLGKPGKFNTFKPDIYVEDGQGLSEYGFDAKVLHLPGHSKGSIGILTIGGDLFCGDLLYNIAGFNFIDDLADFHASIKKLKNLKINTVYPGHGKPFPMNRNF
jgi:hydroxyacylglutathione hydrolase